MNQDTSNTLSQLGPEEAVRRIAKARELLLEEVHKVIVGQNDVLELLLIGLFAQGHCFATGVPGLAKSLAIETLARTLQLRFQRLSFTPDLTTDELVGHERAATESSSSAPSPSPSASPAATVTTRVVQGPIFTNVLLADELLAASPRTQAVLLDAMHDHQVQIGESRWELERPFFVVATHNPVETDGVHPLHEAQLDRFLLSIQLGYPTRDEERQIVMASTSGERPTVKPLLRPRDIEWIQQWVRQIPVAESLVGYAVDLTRATRPTESDARDFAKQWLTWGAGPRAAQSLILAAKARALLKGRSAVHSADIRWVLKPVLRHRLQLNAAARLAQVTLDQILDRIVQTTPDPQAAHRPILEIPK